MNDTQQPTNSETTSTDAETPVPSESSEAGGAGPQAVSESEAEAGSLPAASSSAPGDWLSGAVAAPLGRLHDAAPHARVLSNGRYRSLVTGAGTGVSLCDWYSVTRWQADRVGDNDGVLVWLRDLDSGEFWSLGAAPCGETGGTFYARSAPGSVTLGRRHGGIEATCDVVVAADADGETRRIVLRNRSTSPRRLEVTVAAEVVAGHGGADQAHPAFAKLFVETSFDATTGALVARRRPRSADEAPIFVAACLAGDGELEMESDRCRFLGRARSVSAPAALVSRGRLSGSTGSVLDAVLALRRSATIEAGASVTMAFALAAGAARDEVAAAAAGLAGRARSDEGATALSKAAAAAERERRRRFSLGADCAEFVQDLAGAMLYAHPALAADRSDLEAASFSASPLGQLGIPGDGLIVVAPVAHADTTRVDAVLRAGGYLASLGLPACVVVLCTQDDCRGDGCPLAAIAASASCRAVVASQAALGAEAVSTLKALARWVVRETPPDLAVEVSAPAKSARVRAPKAEAAPAWREKLEFDNGYGGFASDGRSYVVRVGPEALVEPGADTVPPAPWINVVSGDDFGFLAGESGAVCTWAGNSRQNKLTPWSNDPVLDPTGEALYLRDHASGRFWSPLPGPAPSGAWCEVRHAMGWTSWTMRAESIEHEVTTCVAAAGPARLVRVRLANKGSRERKLSLYSFSRLVLGVDPAASSRFVVTSRDEASGVLLARNPLSEDHGGAVAMAAVVSGTDSPVSWTTDRAAFVGRGGSMQAPRAVTGSVALGGETGGDACFAFEVPLTLPPRGRVEVVFALGQAGTRQAALDLASRLREPGSFDAAMAQAESSWKELASAIEVKTPSRSFDLLMNGWLLYQALGCRIRGRSAFYQSGGAFGFRDQLQDSAALVYARPDLARSQVVLHAAHQFEEGDVLHWWHPPAPRGTRTRFSDDLLWLPYLAAAYIGTTGDESVLDDRAPFVRARLLADGEDETYLAPERTAATASVYEHCCRALDRSLTKGPHGLPLMGSGDWNDGMNRVGRQGRGESVWMAFFLAATLDLFLPHVEKRADWERLRRYRQYRADLAQAVDAAAWDGAWYRRAYYDDGTPLGSATSDECRIDAIAQSWAVLSGLVPEERARAAVRSAVEHLVDEEAGIVRLLWPPFDKTAQDPGYIKGYVPGIRENGGQYTHAAVWLVRALARLGDRERALRLFEMLLPASHAGDREAASRYKVEPYVVAADIYGVAPHSGRGGWTWYTGSASWMYRTGLESLLGLTIEEGRILRIKPCIPDSWPGFRLRYRLPDRKTVFDIEVECPDGRASRVVSATVGATPTTVDKAGARIVLRRDGKLHKVKVVMG